MTFMGFSDTGFHRKHAAAHPRHAASGHAPMQPQEGEVNLDFTNNHQVLLTETSKSKEAVILYIGL